MKRKITNSSISTINVNENNDDNNKEEKELNG